jgi:hypothetical protein
MRNRLRAAGGKILLLRRPDLLLRNTVTQAPVQRAHGELRVPKNVLQAPLDAGQGKMAG